MPLKSPESRESPDGPTPADTSHLADEVALAVAPVTTPVATKMRSDVSRLQLFLRQIRTGYLMTGLTLLAGTTIVGTAIPLLADFSDWYMHLAMYLTLLCFVLLYVRAHLLRFRILEVIWFLLSAGLLAFFSWILIDLIPGRLDVLSNRIGPGGLVGPDVALRPAAPLLWLPAVLLWLQVAWLVLHFVLVGRARHRRPAAPGPVDPARPIADTSGDDSG